MPSSRACGGDLGLVASVREGGVGDLEIEVLGHLVLVGLTLEPSGDLHLSGQWAALTIGGSDDLVQSLLGGGEQSLALTSALISQ